MTWNNELEAKHRFLEATFGPAYGMGWVIDDPGETAFIDLSNQELCKKLRRTRNQI